MPLTYPKKNKVATHRFKPGHPGMIEKIPKPVVKKKKVEV